MAEEKIAIESAITTISKQHSFYRLHNTTPCSIRNHLRQHRRPRSTNQNKGHYLVQHEGIRQTQIFYHAHSLTCNYYLYLLLFSRCFVPKENVLPRVCKYTVLKAIKPIKLLKKWKRRGQTYFLFYVSISSFPLIKSNQISPYDIIKTK